MNYVLCAGHERTLFECYNYWDYQSYYARDANVICYNNGEYIYNLNNSVFPVSECYKLFPRRRKKKHIPRKDNKFGGRWALMISLRLQCCSRPVMSWHKLQNGYSLIRRTIVDSTQNLTPEISQGGTVLSSIVLNFGFRERVLLLCTTESCLQWLIVFRDLWLSAVIGDCLLWLMIVCCDWWLQ